MLWSIFFVCILIFSFLSINFCLCQYFFIAIHSQFHYKFIKSLLTKTKRNKLFLLATEVFLSNCLHWNEQRGLIFFNITVCSYQQTNIPFPTIQTLPEACMQKCRLLVWISENLEFSISKMKLGVKTCCRKDINFDTFITFLTAAGGKTYLHSCLAVNRMFVSPCASNISGQKILIITAFFSNIYSLEVTPLNMKRMINSNVVFDWRIESTR